MPIYEFVCGACGERFDALVEMGTEEAECRECGAAGAVRVLSAQAPAMRLVKSRGEVKKQERKNTELRRRTKQNFKESRRRAREARAKRPGS